MTSILRKISSITFFLCLCAAAAWPALGHAQSSVSFTVSPTIFDMTANPGQTWQSSVRVINANPFELRIKIDVVNFIPKGETGTPQFLPLTPETEASSTLAQWISTDTSMTVAAEQTVELPVKITLPNDAAPGGHFAALMISTEPITDGTDKTEVQTAQVISSLIFLRVTGDVTESSQIRSFRTTHYLLGEPEATFELRIENKGNVHVQPQGEIKIYNMWGQERGVIPVNKQTLFGNILPNSVRKYSFTWDSEWSISDFGRYTAVASLVYGTDGLQSMSSKTAFWIIPWKWLLLIFIIVGGFVAFFTFAVKLYIAHMLKLAGITPGTSVPVSPVESIAIATAKKGRARKKVSVVAPIEEGILDLRKRLDHTHSIKAFLNTLGAFITAYWKFFVAIGVLLVFLVLLVLFLRDAFSPAREYEIRIDGDGQSVTVKGDVSGDANVPPSSEISSQPDVMVKIVNRSGDESLTDKVRAIVSAEGLSVHEASSDVGSVEEGTVIVYTPEYADIALRLSTKLQNALLSAYIPEEGKTPELVIYVGSDIAGE